MPLFVCDKCQAIENTALGHFWGAIPGKVWFTDLDLVGKRLCSECMPATYDDGTPTDGGQWHGRFPKEIATTDLIDAKGRHHFKYTAGL